MVKVLSFSLFLVERYRAQIHTDLLQDLREISRETDKLLKQQILIRAKLQNPNQEKPTKEVAKPKEVGVPVKRKFENDVDRPTNIPAQSKTKTGTTSLAAPVLSRSYASQLKSTTSVHSSTTLDVSQVSYEVEEGEDIDLIGESMNAVNADRSSARKETEVLSDAKKAMKLEKRPNSSLTQAEMKAMLAKK